MGTVCASILWRTRLSSASSQSLSSPLCDELTSPSKWATVIPWLAKELGQRASLDPRSWLTRFFLVLHPCCWSRLVKGNGSLGWGLGPTWCVRDSRERCCQSSSQGSTASPKGNEEEERKNTDGTKSGSMGGDKAWEPHHQTHQCYIPPVPSPAKPGHWERVCPRAAPLSSSSMTRAKTKRSPSVQGFRPRPSMMELLGHLPMVRTSTLPSSDRQRRSRGPHLQPKRDGWERGR